MQVSLLKLGANTGRLIEKSSTLQSTNEQLRARVGTLGDDHIEVSAPDKNGLVVQDVDPDGRAADAGIRAGDVIVENVHMAIAALRGRNKARRRHSSGEGNWLSGSVGLSSAARQRSHGSRNERSSVHLGVSPAGAQCAPYSQ